MSVVIGIVVGALVFGLGAILGTAFYIAGSKKN